jgi:hypothetical protein
LIIRSRYYLLIAAGLNGSSTSFSGSGVFLSLLLSKEEDSSESSDSSESFSSIAASLSSSNEKKLNYLTSIVAVACLTIGLRVVNFLVSIMGGVNGLGGGTGASCELFFLNL